MTEVCPVRKLKLASTHAAHPVAAADVAIEVPLVANLRLQSFRWSWGTPSQPPRR
jgi:hypothetical protein